MIALDVLLKKAKKVNVAVTDRCNLKCHICGIWRRTPHRELSLEDYEDFFKRYDWNWVSFTGGEPFLRDDLLEIMRLPLKYCPSIHTISVTTNGYLTNRIVRGVVELLEEGVKSLYVSVSLDGLKNFHDSQRGVRGSFDRSVSTFHKLNELSERGLKVHFEYVISKLSQGNLMETIEGMGLTPNDFIITVAQRSYFYDNEECVNIEPDESILYVELTEFLEKYKIRSIHDIAQRIFLKYVLEKRRIPCTGGTNSFYLDVHSNIHPCIVLPRQLGDIHKFCRVNSPCGRKCYTPCEGYFSLLLGWRESLWKI